MRTAADQVDEVALGVGHARRRLLQGRRAARASSRPCMRKAGADSPSCRPSSSVSKPADPLEKEADRTADKVMRMRRTGAASSCGPHPSRATPQAQRAAAPSSRSSGSARARRRVAADAQSEIQRATTGGQALPSDVRGVHGAAARRRPRRRARPRRRERRQPEQPPQRPGVHLPQPRLLRRATSTSRAPPRAATCSPTSSPTRSSRARPSSAPSSARPRCSALRAGPGDHVRLATRRPAARRPGRARLLRRQGELHPRLPDADARPRLQPDQHAPRRPDRGQLPARADRADPGRRADHPGARQPRRHQQGRRLGRAEGRHARRHRRR